MLPRLFSALTFLFLSHLEGVQAAAVYGSNTTHSTNSSSVDYDISVSVAVPLPYSQTLLSSDLSYDPSSSDHMRRERTVSLKTPPGADTDPHGVIVYNSLHQVPTARLLWRARNFQKCYALPQGDASQCWAAYVCGHRCEPILLAINSFCHMEQRNCLDAPADAGPEGCKDHTRWIRCQKPRKYKRCFARVCFRRIGSDSGGPRPMSYEDPLSISIVRYQRPPPKHEVFARRNRQSSTQSAIFK